MKNLFIFLLLAFINLNLFGQTKKINIQLSKIKWTGKEITTKIHYGSLKFISGNILFDSDEIVGGEFVVDMLSLLNEDLSGRSKDYLENHLRSE
ncbi:MAG: YceI family protein, partial [Flavobacteriaceae bacterium]